MMKLIGRKRFLTIVVLAMINLVLASIYFLWISPSSYDADIELNSLNGQISKLQGDITSIKEQIEETRSNIPYYDALEAQGFFQEQNRFNAEREIKDIQEESQIKTATFSIGSLLDVNEPKAMDAKHRLVVSKVEIKNLKSYTDKEIYRLMYLINTKFPGHTRFVALNIDRPLLITEKDFESIQDPESDTAFVSGTAEFEWYSMLEDAPEEVPDIGTGGF